MARFRLLRSRISWPKVRRWAVAVLSLLSICAAPLHAQQPTSPFEEYLDLESDPTGDQAPRLAFRVLSELPLPGPLPEEGPRLHGDRVAIATAEGLVSLSVDGTAAERPTPGDAVWGPDVRPSWIAPDGRFRVVTSIGGFVYGEKICRRCARGWRRDWRLRVPGNRVGGPLVTARRVFFGAADNRVYCVKRRNGHRVWESDLEERVSRRFALWELPANFPTAERRVPDGLTLLLVVPDAGTSLVALDTRTGETVASYSVAENETLVGGAVVTPDGRIVVARQKYNAADAALWILELAPGPPASAPGVGEPAATTEQAASSAQRTTMRIWPARTSSASSTRISTTSAPSRKPGPL